MAGRDRERSRSPVRRDEQATNVGSNDTFTVDREKVINFSLCLYYVFGVSFVRCFSREP